jgi:site-specific DNA-methyltransferase (adenine-specific)
MLALPERAITPNSIHHMDLFALCNAMPDDSVDMILADLPYGHEKTKTSWDKVIDISRCMSEFHRIVKRRGAIVLTSAQPFTTFLIQDSLETFRYMWYWQKSRGANFGHSHHQPMRNVEDILIFSKSIASANQFTSPCDTMIYYPQMTKFKKTYTRVDKPHHQKNIESIKV